MGLRPNRYDFQPQKGTQQQDRINLMSSSSSASVFNFDKNAEPTTDTISPIQPERKDLKAENEPLKDELGVSNDLLASTPPKTDTVICEQPDVNIQGDGPRKEDSDAGSDEIALDAADFLQG